MLRISPGRRTWLQVGRLAVLGILSITGAFLLAHENLGPVMGAVGVMAVLGTVITTPVMVRRPDSRWPYYTLCILDAVALGVIAGLTRGAESPFIAFMAAHAFIYGFYLGGKGGVTAAAATTVILFSTVALSIHGPPTTQSVLVGTLLSAGQVGLSAKYLLAQAGLNAALFFASGMAGGFLGKVFYSETGRLQQVLDNLAEVRARSRRVLENLRDGVIVVNTRGTLVQANPAAVDILGLPGAEPNALRGTVLEAALTRFLTEERPPESIDLVINERIIQCRFSSVETGEGVIAVLSDITEAANLRAALEERKRLAIVGRLSATLAHEIRNPLASISGAAEMLASGTLPESKTERMTRLIVSQSKRVSELIDGYLSLTRNAEDFPHVPAELTALVTEAIETASHSYAGGVAIGYTGDGMPMTVLGNPTRLGQALGNLLRNAVEAVSDQALGVVEVSTARLAGEGVVTVADNGPGIPGSRLDRVWEPFYTTRADGTGLGLYISRRIAEEHRGRIELKNREGGGLGATLFLPLLEGDHG